MIIQNLEFILSFIIRELIGIIKFIYWFVGQIFIIFFR